MRILSPFIAQAAAAPEGLAVEVIVAIVVGVVLFGVLVAWLLKRARQLEEKEPEELPPPQKRPLEKPKPDKKAELEKRKPEVKEKPEAPRTFEEGLAKTTSEGFVSRLGKLFKGKQLDEALLEEVESVLYTADIGVATTEKLLGALREELGRKELADADRVWAKLRDEALAMLDAANDVPPLDPDVARPFVLMVIGVNGTGKTTSIGKIAARYKAEGKRVLLAAGDTFRAAAVEQLEVWARRVDVEIFKGAEGADPASVIFDAIKHARTSGHDIVLADTAGRLHTHGGLVEELKKVHRVTAKAMDGAPHEVLLVLDSTMGQNAMQQARIFREAVPVTGLVLTKLDGTAKGGVVIGICEELRLPIRFIGVGERIQDLRTFDSREFVTALFGTKAI